MAERSDEAFIIVREFMTRGLGLTGLPLLVYARIYGFCEADPPTSRARRIWARFSESTREALSEQ